MVESFVTNCTIVLQKSTGSCRKINHSKNNNKRPKDKQNSTQTHIFTFEPRVFGPDPDEADVLHMYIIAKLLLIRYLLLK